MKTRLKKILDKTLWKFGYVSTQQLIQLNAVEYIREADSIPIDQRKRFLALKIMPFIIEHAEYKEKSLLNYNNTTKGAQILMQLYVVPARSRQRP